MVAKKSARKKAPRKSKPKTIGVVSVPHSGTHSVIRWLNLTEKTAVKTAPPHHATKDSPVVYGHVWGIDKPQGLVNASDWLPILASRETYMPVRDPAELAYSWIYIHGRGLEMLRASLTEACKIIDQAKINLVDIREIEPENVKGERKRDEEAGKQLAAEFPAYFGEYYGG